MIIRFEAPIDPVAKGRPKFSMPKGAKFVRVYTPSKTRSYEETVAWFGRQAMKGAQPFSDGPLSMLLEFRMPTPKSKPKKWQAAAIAGDILPIVKPDLDNLEKAVKDALNGVCYRDDSQVVYVIKRKVYAERGSVKVTIADDPGYLIDIIRG